MIALVRLVKARETVSMESVSVSGSTSQKRIRHPDAATPNAVGYALTGTITSSLYETPIDRSASSKASVPEWTAITWGESMYEENSCSKAASSGPKRYTPDAATR